MHEQLESAQKQITQQNEDLKKNSERERQLAEYEVQNQSWRSMAEELNLEDPSDAITMIQNLRQECLSQNESLTEKNREIKQLTGKPPSIVIKLGILQNYISCCIKERPAWNFRKRIFGRVSVSLTVTNCNDMF